MTRHETGDGERDRRPFSELTPEEQRERRRAAARKAAETRARRKAEREAAEASASDLNSSTSAAGADDGGESVEHAPALSESQVEVVRTPPAEPVEEGSEEPVQGASAGPVDEAPAAPAEEASAEPVNEAPAGAVATASGTEELAPSETTAASDDSTSPTGEVLLRLSNVTRRFGTTVAIEDVSLEVRAGECHGVVGVNGAGKSTTLAIAAGLVRASAGSIEVLGHGIRTQDAQRQLGVVPDRMRLFDRLTGRQLLVHTAMLHRVTRADAIDRADALLERLGLAPDADRLVADYSIGMQQLVAVAAALIHAPSVVVLDEPFETIDPVATDGILAVLADLRARGGAVLLTSHDMALVERACDHVVVLHGGTVRASGPVDAVRDGLSLERRFARLVGAPPSEELPWLSPSRG